MFETNAPDALASPHGSMPLKLMVEQLVPSRRTYERVRCELHRDGAGILGLPALA